MTVYAYDFFYFTVHKDQRESLDFAVTYLEKLEKYCGMTLVNPDHTHELKYFLSKPCYFGSVIKVKLFQAKNLLEIHKLNTKADPNKKILNGILNDINTQF